MVTKLRRRRLVTLAAAGPAGALLAACAGGGHRTDTSSKKQDQPQSGGQLNLRVTADPFDYDSSYSGKFTPNQFAIDLAYNSLLGYKTGPGVGYSEVSLVPELAARWETPADAQTYIFHLRDGIKFANMPPVNGTTLTSADVKWTYEYASRTGQFQAKNLPAGQYNWLFEGLDRIETPDDSTVVVRFTKPFAPFLTYAASEYNPIVPHEIFDQDGDLRSRIAGTGPFQLNVSASQKGTRWVWAKNPTYFASGRPYADGIQWLVIADDATARAAFQARQLDVLSGTAITAKAAQDIRGSFPEAVPFHSPNPEPYHVWINTTKPPVDDVRVRQAISAAIDREEFVRTFTNGEGKLGLCGALVDTFTQDEIRQLTPYDPAKAKQLLSAAGHPAGVSLEMNYPPAYGDEFVAAAQLFQAQLKKADINLTLKSEDLQTNLLRRKQGDYVVNVTGGLGTLGDPDSYLFQFFYSSSSANYSRLHDQKLDSLITAQRQEGDPAVRKQKVRDAVRYINVDAADGIALFHDVSYLFWLPRVRDYYPSWLNLEGPYTDAWIAR